MKSPTRKEIAEFSKKSAETEKKIDEFSKKSDKTGGEIDELKAQVKLLLASQGLRFKMKSSTLEEKSTEGALVIDKTKDLQGSVLEKESDLKEKEPDKEKASATPPFWEPVRRKPQTNEAISPTHPPSQFEQEIKETVQESGHLTAGV